MFVRLFIAFDKYNKTSTLLSGAILLLLYADARVRSGGFQTSGSRFRGFGVTRFFNIFGNCGVSRHLAI